MLQGRDLVSVLLKTFPGLRRPKGKYILLFMVYLFRQEFYGAEKLIVTQLVKKYHVFYGR
jgi:hypothetical protein